jgi:hypothetical protein
LPIPPCTPSKGPEDPPTRSPSGIFVRSRSSGGRVLVMVTSLKIVCRLLSTFVASALMPWGGQCFSISTLPLSRRERQCLASPVRQFEPCGARECGSVDGLLLLRTPSNWPTRTTPRFSRLPSTGFPLLRYARVNDAWRESGHAENREPQLTLHHFKLGCFTHWEIAFWAQLNRRVTMMRSATATNPLDMALVVY